MDFQDTLHNLTRIARQAGIIVMQYYEQPLELNTKANEFDIVTQADKEAEVFIVNELLKLYPDHHIIGEEGGGMGTNRERAEYLWHVDPIDGTTNFASSIPLFTTSIGLSNRDMVPLVGVVYDPARDELFGAIRGEGAFLNSNSIHVSATSSLKQALVSSGFPTDRGTNAANSIQQFTNVMMKTRGVRRIGSAALELAYVAAGRLDGYWEKGLNSWDVMAGLLLVLEAEGQVTNYKGEVSPEIFKNGEFLVSNGHIHENLLTSIGNS